MSHTIYHTDGFILKSLPFGEANKFYLVLTEQFGLIKIAGQGVRHLKSKLRFNLEDFSFCQVSVVRGREVWRLTSAEKKLKIKDTEKLLLLSRIFSLLLRLLHGEERNDLLFQAIKEGMLFLEKGSLTKEGWENFECIIALRILAALGYIGNLGDFNQFTTSPYFTPEILATMSVLKTRAIFEINKSLKETHL